MKWILIFYTCTNCAGIDPGIAYGWVANRVTSQMVQMPDQATCEAIQKLNQDGECWARPTKVMP